MNSTQQSLSQNNDFTNLPPSSTSPVILEIENVTKSFDDIRLLHEVHLSVHEGETLSIVGPGGCGKTVLLKIIAMIVSADRGSVYYFGKNISHQKSRGLGKIREQTGFLFQNYGLFDSLTVEDNISFFLKRSQHRSSKEIRALVDRMLDQIRLPGIEKYRTDQLSGGMKKRIGLARALIHNPKILILDEPVAGLDPITASAIIKMIRELKNTFQCTIIMVSNELSCTYQLADRIGLMFGGKLYKVDSLSAMRSTNDQVVRQFLDGRKDGPITY